MSNVTLLLDQLLGFCIAAPKQLTGPLRHFLQEISNQFVVDEACAFKRLSRPERTLFLVHPNLRNEVEQWLQKEGHAIEVEQVQTENPFLPPVDQLLRLGEPDVEDANISSYGALGLSLSDEDEIIRLLKHAQVETFDCPEWMASIWAPLHAWRALGELKSIKAISPLLNLVAELHEDLDDWVYTDLPSHLAKIGPSVIQPALALLLDRKRSRQARSAAGEMLSRIGSLFPESRDECVAALRQQFAGYMEESRIFNGYILSELLTLKAIEAKDLIREALSTGKVAESVCGDWEDVQISLGLKDTREHPPTYSIFDDLEIPDSSEDRVRIAPTIVAQPRTKIGRNDHCPCGSGKKYKKCCGKLA